MKTIKRIFLLAFSTLFFANVHTNAQVTIGGETAPVTGATFDLSPTGGYKGVFKLPHISLDNDLTTMSTAFTDGTAIVDADLIGSMVYNTNTTVGAGVYLWDGTKWQAMFSSGASSLLDNIYPVGSIYMSISSTNPGSIIGGTWEAWGEGRVPVGVASSGTFNSVEKTGGEETHTLTTEELPSHNHGIKGANTTTSNGVGDANFAHNGWIPGLGVASGWVTAVNIANTGGDNPHNNLQPYITCYMWKRTN